jgi:glycerol transport system ATP-binding protein
MACIELENVSHSYDPPNTPEQQKTYAVSELSIRWEDGSANALLGPSGCGKTTILNIVSGLLVPSQGRILVDGRDVTRTPPRKRRIAQIFQFPVVYDSMNVYDNLAFPLRNQKVPEEVIRTRVHEMAEILELQPYLTSDTSNLNAAEKQKISLGRGIVREDTQAVLLDEPLTVIDPKLKGTMRRKLRQVQMDLGKTMLYVTHDQHEALTFADDVTIVKDGRLVQKGPPQELHAQPASPFIGYFIGSPGMNILDCRMMDTRLSFADFELPLSQQMASRLTSLGDQFQLGIRPEFLQVRTEPAQGGVPFTVSVTENTGAYRVVTLERQTTRIKARVPESIAVSEGQELWLVFPEDKVNIFKDEKRVV